MLEPPEHDAAERDLFLAFQTIPFSHLPNPIILRPLNQSIIRAKGRYLFWFHAKMAGDPVVRPTEIDEAYKFLSANGPRPDVIAERQRKRLSARTPGRIVHDGLAP